MSANSVAREGGANVEPQGGKRLLPPPSWRAGFRLRVAALFMLVGLVPLGAAVWVFGFGVENSEVQKTDLRLEAAVRVASAGFIPIVGEADRLARLYAGSAQVRRDLKQSDRARLGRLVSAHPSLLFYAGGSLLAGTPPRLAILRSAVVPSATGNGFVGRVVVAVPLDEGLLARLAGHAPIGPHDQLVFVERGRIVSGSVGVGEEIVLAGKSARRVNVGGGTYRAFAVPITDGVRLVGLTPQGTIDSGTATRRDRAVLALVVSLLTLGLLGYFLAPTLARSGFLLGRSGHRTPTGRQADLGARDARDVVALVGNALAATHNLDALLPVILEATMEATGATAAQLVDDGRIVARAGQSDPAGDPLALELRIGESRQGLLLLHPPRQGFAPETLELARSLAAQAAIALANAHLHGVVKRQSITDELTQLPNRRRFMEAFSVEVRRADRFEGALALILVDIDNFKSVNDDFGHQAGDAVLRALAEVLARRLREVDLPARIGGEEFAILLPETNLEGAQAVAESVRRSIEGLEVSGGQGRQLRVTASFGVVAHRPGQTEAEVFAAADMALYRAKREGKNRVVTAPPL
jgi:diguanylate cyclase (GGDEF)-like protein